MQVLSHTKVLRDEFHWNTFDHPPYSPDLAPSELKKEKEMKWQRDWTQTTKGRSTKEYFPDIEGRLKMKLNLRESHIQSNGTRERESIPKSLQTHI